MNKTGLSWALVMITGLATACAVTAPDSSNEELAIGIGDDGPPDPADPPPVCTDYDQNCTKTYLGGYMTALQQQLGCGQTYQYWTGNQAGFLGGKGSFCPDTAIIRNALNAHGYHGYRRPYCTTCLTMPIGKLWVFWTESYGPGCPSTCVTDPPPPWF